jgi:hypothetical protein
MLVLGPTLTSEAGRYGPVSEGYAQHDADTRGQTSSGFAGKARRSLPLPAYLRAERVAPLVQTCGGSVLFTETGRERASCGKEEGEI